MGVLVDGNSDRRWEEWVSLLMGWATRWSYLLEPGEEPRDAIHDFLVEKGEKLLGGGYSDGAVVVAFRNFLISRYRARKNRPRSVRAILPADATYTLDPQDPEPLLPAVPHLEGLEVLRSLGRGRGSPIDRGAVLLVHERTHAAIRAGAVHEDGRPGGVAFSMELYPWNDDDEQRRIRERFAPNGELWNQVVERILASERFQIAHLAAVAGVAASLWAKWVQRSRCAARAAHGDDVVARCFPHWPSPDGRASGGGRR